MFFEWLFDKNITVFGTMQGNYIGIPDENKIAKDRELLNSKIYYEKNGPTNISSHVIKTSKGKKSLEEISWNQIMLPIIKPLRGLMTNDDKQEPALYKIYDFTKGGTVTVDQKIQFYSVKTKSRKWTVIVFSYLIHTISLNCVILLP